jgi:hypothetical protein
MSTSTNSLKVQFQDGDGSLKIPEDKFREAITSMESQQSVDEEVVKPKKRTTKKSKDPNAPKRAMSAYLRWVGENRSQIKASLGEGHKPTEVMKEAGRQWKLITDEDKAPFEVAFKADQERYKAEMVLYKPPAVADSYSAEDYPEAPEGWSGPYQLKYLFKHAGPDGKAMRFKDFDEAIKVGATIEDCKGITKTSRWYELRRGPDLMSATAGKESSALASWTKGTPVTPVVMIPTDTSPSKPEEKEEKIEPVKIPKKKSVMKKVKVVEPEAEPEPEPEPEPELDDDEDEDEDEECEVDEIDIDGETYYKGGDGTLYDPDTSETVGKCKWVEDEDNETGHYEKM